MMIHPLKIFGEGKYFFMEEKKNGEGKVGNYFEKENWWWSCLTNWQGKYRAICLFEGWKIECRDLQKEAQTIWNSKLTRDKAASQLHKAAKEHRHLINREIFQLFSGPKRKTTCSVQDMQNYCYHFAPILEPANPLHSCHCYSFQLSPVVQIICSNDFILWSNFLIHCCHERLDSLYQKQKNCCLDNHEYHPKKSRKYELKPRADGTAPMPRVGREQGGYWDHQGLLPGSWDFFFTLVVRTSCAQFHVTNNNHQLLQLGSWDNFYINIMKI